MVQRNGQDGIFLFYSSGLCSNISKYCKQSLCHSEEQVSEIITFVAVQMPVSVQRIVV